MRSLLALLALLLATPAAAADWPVTEADLTLNATYRFRSGETLPSLRIHYTTLGTPHRGRDGQIDNAVLVLHGTGGTGKQFLQPQFADELFGPGAPLDIATTYIILPDNIGHGGSSKPSDGMRLNFPHYDYDDMVDLQHRLLGGLGVTRLKLILGTSMGCMHAFVWGTTYPGFAERLAPFACNPVEIAGRNRLWRKLSIDAIRADPAWMDGNYASQPMAGMRTATSLSLIAGANPLAMQANFPTRAAIEAEILGNYAKRFASAADANDTLYWLDASRNYNPAPLLERIHVPVLWINSADDFINPPELGIAEREVKRMPRAKFILIPAGTETKGHGTHTWAKFWKKDLAKLLATQ